MPATSSITPRGDRPRAGLPQKGAVDCNEHSLVPIQMERRELVGQDLPQAIAIQVLNVSLFREGRRIQSPELRTILQLKEPDAVTMAPYFRSADGELHMVMMERLCLPAAGATLTLLPRRYLHEASLEFDLGAASQSILSRSGSRPLSAPSLLSGPSTPLPGVCPVVVFPFACEIEPWKGERVYFDPFYGPIRFRPTPAQVVISNSLSSPDADLNALHSAFRLSSSFNLKVFLPNHIKSVVEAARPQRLEAGHTTTAAKLESHVWGTPPPGVPDELRVDAAPADSKSFLRTCQVQVERRYKGYQDMHQIQGDVVGLSAPLGKQVAVVCFVRGRDPSGKDDVYVLGNIGSRELTSRELSNHPIQSEEPEQSLEPVTFYTGDNPAASDIVAQVSQQTGLKPRGAPAKVGSFRLIPEFLDLSTDLYLLEVDASNFNSTPNVPGLWQSFVSLDELRRASDEGVNRSLLLATGAELIGAALGYQYATARPFAMPDEERRFTELIRTGSHYRDLLAQNFSKQLLTMGQSDVFHRLLELAFNDGVGFKDSDVDFYSEVPEYALNHELPPFGRFMLLLHDWFHSRVGSFIPQGASESAASTVSLEDYTASVLLDESEAVFFSDVFLAQRYGYDAWRAENHGEPSLGEALEISGLNSPEEKKAAVREIICNGKVPSALLQSQRWAEFRDTVLYFRAYHDRDVLNATRSFEFWNSHPETARAVTEFNPHCSASVEEHRRSLEDTISLIGATRDRGINPIKNRINSVRNTELLKSAVRVGFLLDTVTELVAKEELMVLREKLVTLRGTLEGALTRAHGVHSSSGNVAAWRLAEVVETENSAIHERIAAVAENIIADPASREQLLTRIPLWEAMFDVKREWLRYADDPLMDP